MDRPAHLAAPAVLSLLLCACNVGASDSTSSFESDLRFLQRHTDVVVLGAEPGGPRVAVVPRYQGRVMTSTTGGAEAASLGWINHELIESGQLQPHINAFGGEDRFWLGPEGGQYAIFFRTGDPFDLTHWQTPALIDSETYEVAGQTAESIRFRHQATISNYSGSRFDLGIDRVIRLLDREQCATHLGVDSLGQLEMVAYESTNRITNCGDQAWTRDGGLLSIWILGMFQPTDTTTVVVPFRPGPESELGKVVNDAYFGKVPDNRLAVGEQALFFRGDGRHRSKIGVPPGRAMPVLGSYDPARRLLTLVQYTLPDGVTDYVNSMWELQKEPYGGDVVNSYNDGPPAPGKKALGPFYELETSSPAKALAPGESLEHTHRTIHLRGDPESLDQISRKLLGVSLEQIENAL